MAVQTRRGAYENFDPNKLLAGEWATVLSGDPNASDGRAAYLCFDPGEVKRMATYEDMEENINAVTDDIVEELTTEVNAATSAANTATQNANTAAQNANSKASAANAAASAANTAAGAANGAAEEAESAATAATTAAGTANTAATNANEKANAANTAAGSANTAATNANNKASVANTAATNAQNIADTVEEKLEAGEFIGPQGQAATIQIGTVTTGAAGSNAEVTNSGTSNAAVLNFKIPQGPAGQLENIEDQAINFTEYATDTDIASGDVLKNLFGKLLKNIKTIRNSLSTHIANKSNPHSVTKIHIGLGNVDNTSDTDKPISTATQNALNGKANTSHKHAATDITSGTLPLTRGGTGQTSLANVKIALGITALENNFANLLDTDTIDAAENAGITGETGITLLNSILQETLINPIVEETVVDAWVVRKYTNGKAEAIFNYTTPLAAISQQSGAFYKSVNINRKMPTGVFKNVYRIEPQMVFNGSGVSGIGIRRYSPTDFDWYVWTSTAWDSGVSIIAIFKVEGTWK